MTDSDGFDEFFAAHHLAVFRTVALACGDPTTAEDATQEAFARAYVRWRRVSAMARPVGWVTVTAMNEVRRRKRRPAAPVVADRPAEAATDPASAVVTTAELAEALDRLPLRQRQAVVLRHLGGLSIEEVAGGMGCAVGTVKSTLHAAHRSLRVDLGDEREETGHGAWHER